MNSPRQASSDNIDFPTICWFVGIVECESSAPEKVFDDDLLQFWGVMANFCLEMLNNVLWIMERATDKGFRTVHKAVKAISGLLPVVGADIASIAIIDGGGHKVDIPIEEINMLSLNREPCPSIDPRAPAAKIGNDRVGGVIEAKCNRADVCNI